jgi:hypothetical protein
LPWSRDFLPLGVPGADDIRCKNMSAIQRIKKTKNKRQQLFFKADLQVCTQVHDEDQFLKSRHTLTGQPLEIEEAS